VSLVSDQVSGEEQDFNSDSLIRELCEKIMNSVLAFIWAKRRKKR
jgi:hypothetical protein